MQRISLALACLAVTGVLSAAGQKPLTLRVDPGKTTAAVSPMLYGLMTEEINYSYDGGLYAEMLRNRTFEKSWSGIAGWQIAAGGNSRVQLTEANDGPSKALPRSARLTVLAASQGNEGGIANTGYWGMAVRPSSRYTGSFYAKADQASPLHVSLVSDDTGEAVAQASVALTAGGWQRYSFTLTTGAAAGAGERYHLLATMDQPGSVLLQLFSLMAPTYRDTPNGNRVDLMGKLAAMHPKFLRMPGGNYLEGDTFKERYNWEEQVGPLVDRPTHRSPWGYTSTDGEGLLEMLRWCEDLHMEPLLAVFAGYSLKGEHVEGPALEPYIDSALREIEYVTGDASTPEGARRAKDGHPAPFALRYVEIGNEDEFDKSGSYGQRFSQFAAAIRAKYPRLKLIATAPVTMGAPDLIDDHFYRDAEEMYAMVHHYDHADRQGPKVFVGEWATRVGSPTPNMEGALGDAAWMTGMERNSDLVVMSSYAPLLTNVNPGGMQWSSDLIGYDALHSYGSPSYWAQVMFATHIGDHVVASTADHEERRFFWSTTVSQDGKTLFVKLVNASDKPQPLTLELPGVRRQQAAAETLHAASNWATNSITQPEAVHPVDSKVEVSGHAMMELPPFTIQVLTIELR